MLTSLGGGLFSDWTHPFTGEPVPRSSSSFIRNRVASPYRFILPFRFLGDLERGAI